MVGLTRTDADPGTLLGMGLAAASLLVTVLLEGGNPTAIILLPPLILVFGGSFGAAIAGSTSADLRQLSRWFRLGLIPRTVPPPTQRIADLVALAATARKEGLLALDRRLSGIEDPFLRRGLRLAIDGTDPEQLREVLEAEIAARRSEDLVAARFFLRLGGYSPTIGIIGTVVGLIHVLATLDDQATLGPLIASAFVATLWGVLSANFFWLPMSTRITRSSDLRSAQMSLLLTGVSDIQAGVSPRAMRLRLTALLPPSEVQRQAA
jgi:chemotaxis protein MotA